MDTTEKESFLQKVALAAQVLEAAMPEDEHVEITVEFRSPRQQLTGDRLRLYNGQDFIWAKTYREENEEAQERAYQEAKAKRDQNNLEMLDTDKEPA